MVAVQPKYGGKPCAGELKEIRGCNDHKCVPKAVVGEKVGF